VGHKQLGAGDRMTLTFNETCLIFLLFAVCYLAGYLMYEASLVIGKRFLIWLFLGPMKGVIRKVAK
jgi:hypothetical protein